MEFEEIYLLYFADVYRYALKLSGNESVAEEITSDTFFKAMNNIHRFKGECDLRVWLCQIAKHRYYDNLRKNQKLTSMESHQWDQVADATIPVMEQLTQANQLKQIEKWIHTLGEPYKEVFMWRIFADLSYKQIAQLFGKSENWACVTYHRAKKQIQIKMKEEDNEQTKL